MSQQSADIPHLQRIEDLLQRAGSRAAPAMVAALHNRFSCRLCGQVAAFPCQFVTRDCECLMCGICLYRAIISSMCHNCGQWHHRITCPSCNLPFGPEGPAGHLTASPITYAIFAGHQLDPDLQSVFRMVDSLTVYLPPHISDWQRGGDLRVDWSRRHE
ncbi:hypothetical protein HYDPIDRAFT_34964 [Hydnomerulius pinastri MD-312]|uniref:Uncharacterized protein n=1 Tax=Hydnomerulius pinastri MD-312 TaxID=994086 RepID=A0A0C2PWT7_9AGAM|nr:hypothetical protein HYDPIDRAFT_34964 [Hydnomerulius pinastri MD-312]